MTRPNPRAGSGEDSGDGSSRGSEGSSGGGSSGTEPGSRPGTGGFVPRRHHDSGGGSVQFRVKGGDNSVQEFGSEARAAEFAAVAAALHGYLDARAEQSWAAACSHLAGSVRESLEALVARTKESVDTSCAAILAKLTNPAAAGELRAEAAHADIGSVRVEGDRAFVIYRGLGNTILATSMAREGGAWGWPRLPACR